MTDQPIRRKNKNFSLGTLVFAVEFTLLVLGIIWMLVRRIPVIDRIHVNPRAFATGILVGVLLLASSGIFYLIDKFFFNQYLKNTMEKKVYPMFRHTSFPEILLIAVMSGFCEEFFFRGILTPEMGILVSSVIFGLLHTSSKKTWFLGVWTGLIGASLAMVYQITGNLFIPMVAHGFNNFLAVAYVRYIHFGTINTTTASENMPDNDSPPAIDSTEKDKTAPAKEFSRNESCDNTDKEINTADEPLREEDSLAQLGKEASQVIRKRVEMETDQAKGSIREIIREAREFAHEIEEEFTRRESHGPPDNPAHDTPVPEDTESQDSRPKLSIPEPEYESIGDIDRDIKPGDMMGRFRDFSRDVESFFRDDPETVTDETADKDEGISPSGEAPVPDKAGKDQSPQKDSRIRGKKRSRKPRKGSYRLDHENAGPSIPPSRKAPDTDGDGIGVVDEPM